jgi:galactose mutarotase-like enzyme
MYTIQSDEITIKIDSLGSQPKRIISAEMKEYLWTGNPSIWKDSAPLLFPFIGRFQNQKYTLDNKEHPATIHGFIAKREFTVIKHEKETLEMIYYSTEKDQETYPSPFEFIVNYKIIDNTLYISHEVRNRGSSTMHFGMGFHPGFNVPLSQTGKVVFEDYYLQFHKPVLTELLMEETCLYSGKETSRILKKGNKLPLRHTLFDNDALIFRDWGDSVSLQETTGLHEIKIVTKDFPYLTIWHHPNSQDPFICIEPCVSIPGEHDKIVDIAKKEDYIHLSSGGTYLTNMMITFRG